MVYTLVKDLKQYLWQFYTSYGENIVVSVSQLVYSFLFFPPSYISSLSVNLLSHFLLTQRAFFHLSSAHLLALCLQIIDFLVKIITSWELDSLIKSLVTLPSWVMGPFWLKSAVRGRRHGQRDSRGLPLRGHQ